MNWKIIFTLFIYSQSVQGQIGFNQSYDFDQRSAIIGSMQMLGDTLVVFGTVLEPGKTESSLLFAKMDTLGNVIDIKLFNDSINYFTRVDPKSFVRTSDSIGFVGIGSEFNSSHGFFSKFDNTGELILLKLYPDSTTNADLFKQIVPIQGGYLIAGHLQDEETYLLSIFVIKTDLEGNVIWKKKFPTPTRETLFGNLTVSNENEYVLSGTTTSKVGTELPLVKNTSKIFAIDSMGIIKWSWESQTSLEEMGAGFFHKSPEGNWGYFSGRGWYNATYNEILRQPKFIIRDENFNLLFEDTFSVAETANTDRLYSVIEMNTGGYLAVGTKYVTYLDPPIYALAGWMIRLDHEGTQLWSRVDTSFWSALSGSENYYYTSLELPSGSIIACGYNRTYDPENKEWAWLVKISSDGCVDTLNCMSLNTSQLQGHQYDVNIYPNPTSGLLHIHNVENLIWERIELIDTSGKLIRVWNNTMEEVIDLSSMEDGVYFVRMLKSNKVIAKKVVKCN